jgi:hypothetical protein
VSGYSWDNLSTYIGQIVDEAINSAMYLNQYFGSVESGFQGHDVNISPLGGHYEGSTMVPGGQVTSQLPDSYGSPAAAPINPGWPFRTVQELVAYFPQQILPLFDPWWFTPRPEEFQGPVDHSRQAAHLLSYEANTGSGPGTVAFGANLGLSHITTMQERLSEFDGAAMRTFQDQYANRLPLVTNSQDACACMLWVGAAGEQAIWVKARESLAEIAGNAVEAMKKARGGGGDGIGALLNVLGAVALVAAPFTGGASEVLEGGLTIAGVVLQTSSDFAKEGGEGEKVPLGAGDPLSVIANLSKALDSLNRQVKTEEQGIAKSMDKICNLLVGDQRASFDMSSPALLTDDKAGDLRTSADTKVKTDTLRWVADTIMPTIVQQYKGAAGALEAAQGEAPWSRNGDVGMGGSGPYFDWYAVNSYLVGALDDSATQLGRASTVLHIVANDFDKTDAQVQSDLTAQTKKVQQEDYAAATAERYGHNY